VTVDQGDVDEVFGWIAECDRTLDDVIAMLAAVGVEVTPEQRLVVSRWLDMFNEGSPVPLPSRLAMLKGMLQS